MKEIDIDLIESISKSLYNKEYDYLDDFERAEVDAVYAENEEGHEETRQEKLNPNWYPK